ncbi:MAG TPA: hypothetical protein DDZ51_01210 [Planctomycetaceae bacterium]|nr:hypothetical protein [Planctomycetaceae bacterium]
MFAAIWPIGDTLTRAQNPRLADVNICNIVGAGACDIDASEAGCGIFDTFPAGLGNVTNGVPARDDGSAATGKD